MTIEATRAARVGERLGERLTRLERREDRLERRAAQLEEAGIDPSRTRIDERSARIDGFEENVKQRLGRVGDDETKAPSRVISATPSGSGEAIDILA